MAKSTLPAPPVISARAPRAPKAPAVFNDPEVEKSLERAAALGIAVLKKYHRAYGEIIKKGAVDLVTRADRESEHAVLGYLRKRHPDHALIGEESWAGEPPLPAGYAWIVDPLDGTTNYAHGMNHYAISIGVTYNGEPVAGIVADPARGEIYRAWKGRGAWRDKTRLAVSTNRRMIDSLIATGFPYDRQLRSEELTRRVAAFLAQAQDLRRLGVASLDLALVAAGQFEGYYEGPLKIWDAAAGVLLVTEAGGRVTNFEGGKLDLFNPMVVASNGKVHAAMLKIIAA